MNKYTKTHRVCGRYIYAYTVGAAVVFSLFTNFVFVYKKFVHFMLINNAFFVLFYFSSFLFYNTFSSVNLNKLCSFFAIKMIYATLAKVQIKIFFPTKALSNIYC